MLLSSRLSHESARLADAREPDEIATDLSTRGGPINLNCGIQHISAIHIKSKYRKSWCRSDHAALS